MINVDNLLLRILFWPVYTANDFNHLLTFTDEIQEAMSAAFLLELVAAAAIMFTSANVEIIVCCIGL